MLVYLVGVDFVNEEVDLLILVGVCWVRICGYADLGCNSKFLEFLVGVCWYFPYEF